MAKKTSKKSLTPKKITPAAQAVAPQGQQKLPPEVEKKLQALKEKLDKLKDKILDKFGDYIVGITLLPPDKPPQDEEAKKNFDPDKINVLVVVDDTTSKKMTKDELHKRFSTLIAEMAKKIDKHLAPQAVLLTDLWQNSYDGKFDLNHLISVGAPVYDTGMLAAIKIAEIHKSMVIKKFEKYVLSYVLAGSLTQGRATASSDIDVWIVVDDTDVKKMSRAELKDKLRAIIIGLGVEAGEMTGIKNKLNIQVYILTDFWDSLKEANPIIFTLLRDGVPFYDRGIFMPWKQLLRMGRIKPSREAIDLFMNTGEQGIKRVKHRLKEMGMEDLYYAILTPSQAAIMLYGLPPPTPRETPEVMEEIFVKKEKMLEASYIKILKANVDLRKKIEHGTTKEVSGTELDKFITNAEKYLKRVKELFTEIEKMHENKSMAHLYDEVVTVVRDVLRLEGVNKAQDAQLVKLFKDELIEAGKVPARYLRDFEEVVAAKEKFDKDKLSAGDIQKARKASSALLRYLVEHMQRKHGQRLEKTKIRVKHGKKFGEVVVLDEEVFVIQDTSAKQLVIEKGKLKKNGGIGTLSKSDLEEFEKALANAKLSQQLFLKEEIFEDIKRIFGKDVEVLLHN